MFNNNEQMKYLEYCIDAWHHFGNQETFWMDFSRFPDAFQTYIQDCANAKLSWMCYEYGCDLLENYLECLEEGIAPTEGWRFRLLKAVENLGLDWKTKAQVRKPHIWKNEATVYDYNNSVKDAEAHLAKHTAYLKLFCSSMSEWRQEDLNGQPGRRWVCDITY